MGLTVRHFWLQPDGSIRPISWRNLRPIWDGEVVVPGAENQVLRFAEVMLECEDRHPKRIMQARGTLLYCGPDGRVDQEKQMDYLRLALSALPLDPEPSGKVRSIVSERSQQRLRREYTFRLKPKEVESICRVIWKAGRPSR
jgi:hypothetical protein